MSCGAASRWRAPYQLARGRARRPPLRSVRSRRPVELPAPVARKRAGAFRRPGQQPAGARRGRARHRGADPHRGETPGAGVHCRRPGRLRRGRRRKPEGRAICRDARSGRCRVSRRHPGLGRRRAGDERRMLRRRDLAHRRARRDHRSLGNAARARCGRLRDRLPPLRAARRFESKPARRKRVVRGGVVCAARRRRP